MAEVTIEDVYAYMETPDAWLIGFDEEEPEDADEKYWIPKSACETDIEGVGDRGYITISERLAKDKDLEAFVD